MRLRGTTNSEAASRLTDATGCLHSAANLPADISLLITGCFTCTQTLQLLALMPGCCMWHVAWKGLAGPRC